MVLFNLLFIKYQMRLDNNNQPPPPSWLKIYQQTTAILYKNLANSAANKRKILGEFILPLMISVIYILTQTLRQNNLILSMILTLLLKIYIGLIGTSALRQLISLFISERNDQFRQYQMICGLSYKTHTLANLLYMKIYLSVTILPFFLTLNYFQFYLPYILYFAAFVLSSTYLTLALTAFFKDQKVALQVIGLFFSLSSFLPFLYNQNDKNAMINYIIMMIPNSSFTIAVMNKDSTASFISFSLIKIYLLIYFFIQFRQIMSQKLRYYCGLIKQYIPILNSQNDVLMEEFQMNEIQNPHPQIIQNNSNIIIKTQSLSKHYIVNNHQFYALNGLNLKIYQSQIFGLLGRNGAGKTTFVDILTKVTKPSQGTVEIASINGIGICYQHQILYQNLTVRQHLNFYFKLKILKQVQRGIEDVVEMLKIQSQLDKKVKDLSGGNKRKLSIAIAVLSNPQILIFDEPTSGLDPLSRTYIWDIMIELKKRKSTIILTTHHLDEAQKLSDNICVIQKGKCIVQNTAESIKQKYGKGFHLKISPKNNGDKLSISLDKYKQFLQEIKLKICEIQSSPNSINVLVKPHPFANNNLHFEQAFQTFIKALERQQNIKFRFHSNTLQESFIAILKDEDYNSGDSLGDQNGFNRHLNLMSAIGIRKWFCQIWGIILKNFYYRKSILLQSLTLYNINIIIFFTYYCFNSIISQNFQKSQKNDKVQQENSSKSMMLLQGYIAMATAFITCPVYETEKKIKSMLSTRGLMRSCYWIGNFLFDYTIFLLNLLIIRFFVAPEAISEVGYQEICLLGASTIFYAYCVSNMFQKSKTASTWFSVINMVFGFLVMPMIIVGKFNSSLKRFQVIKYFYPFYDLTLKSININNTLANLSLQQQPSNQSPTVLITLLFYIFALYLIQMHPIQRIFFACSKNLQTETQNTIQLRNISKNYGKITALNNVNYSIHQQRVALLGHNGAGKSTTFSLLTLQSQQTSGSLYISKKLALPYERVLKSAGICYQEDTLWQQILVDNIISILEWIVPIEDGQAQVRWLFQNLQFDAMHRFKRFKSLSGGNKRKLCLIFALFGNPELRLLDECSTGLDPSSRVAMVQTIKHSKKGSTLFTTHSMGQAQKVCNKVIIMSKGRVIELEEMDKLVEKYFDCWWIEVLLASQYNVEQFSSLIPQHLQASFTLINQHKKIRIEVNAFAKRSQVLEWLCGIKKAGLIDSYSCIQPVLEDVYIKLTSGHSQEQYLMVES